MVHRPGTEQRALIFSLTLDEVLFGYTDINMHSRFENYPHFHTFMHTDPTVQTKIRAALKRAPRARLRLERAQALARGQ
jgi:hypothetical protein